MSDKVFVLECIKFWNFGLSSLDFMAIFTSNIFKHNRQAGESPPKRAELPLTCE